MIDVSTGNRYYYFCDGLGSVVALSKFDNGNGYAEIVERYKYSAFGETQILSPNSELSAYMATRLCSPAVHNFAFLVRHSLSGGG